MRLLLLVQNEQRIILDRFYDEISKQFEEATVLRLTSNEQNNLKKYFKSNINCEDYDRIVLFLRFKKEIKQVSFLRTIPNLVFLEHDAYQNYIDCKYKGKFSKHYKKIPWVRVLTSGFTVSQKLKSEGVDAVFVPKCYDDQMIYNLHLKRDIEMGFIGSTKSKAYSQRKALLEQLAREENLLITRTKSGQEYVETLNRIKFFISADVGMGEYMIKNFEAMAAGCILCAWNQGEKENFALSLRDMENVVLYSSVNELKEKLSTLRANTDLAKSIALRGNQLAIEKYAYNKSAEDFSNALRSPLKFPESRLLTRFIKSLKNTL